MKKFILLLSCALTLTSCIVVKVYETPKDDKKEPKLLRENRRFITSGLTVPVPNEGTEILFIGDDHPPVPMPLDEHHFSLGADSLAQKSMVIVQLNTDSIQDMEWVAAAKGAGAHKMPKAMFFVKKDSLSMPCSPEMMADSMGLKACCAEKSPMKKRIHIMKMDASTQSSGQNTFIMKAEEGKDPLIVIDGEIQEMAVMKDLSPDKIETIDVLKGEAAAKEFGEKGANGVIKIRLKQE